MNLLSQLVSLGEVPHLTTLELLRVRTLNRVALVGAALTLIFCILKAILGIWLQSGATLAYLLLVLLPIVWVHARKRHRLARHLLIATSIASVMGFSLLNIRDGGPVGPELALVGLVTVINLMFDGRARLYYSLGSLLSLNLIHVVRHWGQDISWSNQAFLLPFFYYSLVILMVYYFTSLYLQHLNETAEEMNKLNRAFRNNSDILERAYKSVKTKSEELEQRRLFLRSLIDMQPFYLAMLDREGRYIVVNKRHERLFGTTIDKIEGKLFRRTAPGYLYEVHNPFLQRALAGEPVSVEIPLKGPDGREFYSLGKYLPVTNASGEVLGVTVYIMDTTEAKQKEARLEELNRQKDLLFKLVSQDLSSPVSVLNELLDRYQRALIEPQEFARKTQEIQDQLATLSLTLENLQRWATAQLEEHYEVSKEPVDLAGLVMSHLATYGDLMARREVQPDLDMPDRQLVNADKALISLVVRNLLNQSLELSQEYGILIVRIRQTEDQVRLTVSDNGQGLDEEELKAMFDTPLQAETAIEGDMLNARLGISISRQIVAAHGGELEIETVRDMGTTFRVILPRN